MPAFFHLLALTAPLFLLVLLGYALSHWGRWPRTASDALTRFVFSVAIPAFLFRLMSDFSRLPPVDARLLIAYFGGCLVVFTLGRVIAATLFRLDGAVAIGVRHGRHLRQHRAARHSADEGHAGRRVDAFRVAGDRLQFAAACGRS